MPHIRAEREHMARDSIPSIRRCLQCFDSEAIPAPLGSDLTRGEWYRYVGEEVRYHATYDNLPIPED